MIWKQIYQIKYLEEWFQKWVEIGCIELDNEDEYDNISPQDIIDTVHQMVNNIIGSEKI